MRDALDGTKPLPFAPGQSPFHVKGLVYKGHLDWVAANCPGGVEAQNRAFADPRVAAYFEQRFLPSSWYDLLPAIAAAYVVARLCGTTLAEFLRVRARHQAERDLGGIYRLLLKFTSPNQVVTRYAAVQSQYFDFGASSARLVGPGHAIVERRQFPVMMVDWMTPVQETFAQVAVAAAGGKRVKVETPPPPPDEPVHGVATVCLSCVITWT